MKLKALTISRMPGFKEGGPSFLEGIFSNGLNILYGPNGSGKTSTCNAILSLLWPKMPCKIQPLSLCSLWEKNEKEIQITREATVSQVLPITEEALLDDLPPFSLSKCFTITVDDLFGAEDNDLAQKIGTDLKGGYDLDNLKKQLSLPKFFGRVHYNRLIDRKKAVEKIKGEHQLLEEKEKEITSIEEEIFLCLRAKSESEQIEKTLTFKQLENKIFSLDRTLEEFSPFLLKYQKSDYQQFVKLLQEEKRGKERLAREKSSLSNAPSYTYTLEEIRKMRRQLSLIHENEIALETLNLQISGKRKRLVKEKQLAGLTLMESETFSRDTLIYLDQLILNNKDIKVRLSELIAKKDALLIDPPVIELDEIKQLITCLKRIKPFSDEGLFFWALLFFSALSVSIGAFVHPSWYFVSGISALITFWALFEKTLLKRMLKRFGLYDQIIEKREKISSIDAKIHALYAHALMYEKEKSLFSTLSYEISVIEKKEQEYRKELEDYAKKHGVEKSLEITPLFKALERVEKIACELEELEGQKELLEEALKVKKDLFDQKILKNILSSKELQNLTDLWEDEYHAYQKWHNQNEQTKEKIADCNEVLEKISQDKELICKKFDAKDEELIKELSICEEQIASYLKIQKEKEQLIGAKELCYQGAKSYCHHTEETLLGLKEEFDRKKTCYEGFVDLKSRLQNELMQAKKKTELEETVSLMNQDKEALKEEFYKFCFKVVGQALIERSEKGYQKRCQPAVFQKSNERFIQFTEGSYQLQYDHDQLLAKEAQTGELKMLRELSRGTRMQLLLAVRLSFAFLSDGKNELPLFFDDILISSDEKRFKAIADVLSILAKERQIFYFTCRHDEALKLAQHISCDFALVDMEKSKKSSSLNETISLNTPIEKIPLSFFLKNKASQLKKEISLSDTAFPDGKREIPFGEFKTLSLINPKLISSGLMKEIEVKAEILEEFFTLSQIGRAKFCNEDIYKAKVSKRFLHPIIEIAKENHYDPFLMLKVIKQKKDMRIKGIRDKTINSLEKTLYQSGLLKDENALTKEEIIKKLSVVAKPCIEGKILKKQELNDYIKEILQLL